MQGGLINEPIEEKSKLQNVENQNLDRLTFIVFLHEKEDWTR